MSAAAAENYPIRPLRLIVASSASSAADIVGRIYAQLLGGDLGKQVIVDNRAGAGGNLGAIIAASAAADGYTLFLGTPAHVISSSMSRNPQYDLAADFSPISQVSTGVWVIAVNPSLGVKNIGDFIALAKAKPGRLNFASGGTGNATHLAVELFKTMAGIDVVHLPYQGAGPAMIALISGEAQFAALNLTAALPHLATGKLVGLAVTSAKRSSFLPQLPTLAESGMPGYDATAWFGVLAPKGLPRELVAKLNANLVREARAPETAKALAKEGAEPVGSSPDAFGAFIQAEKKKWGEVVRKAGITSN